MPKKSSRLSLTRILKKPGFWFILALLVIITYLHYEQALEHPQFISQLLTDLGLTRHAFERILYLAPIVWAGFLFGWVGGLTTSLITLALMLPRALLISEDIPDSLFETGSVFIIGNVLAMTFYALHRERKYRVELEEAQARLHFYLGQVNKAQEEERKRISQELHDDTIQALVVLSRQLDIMASTGTDLSETYRQRLEKLRQQTNSIMMGIRRLCQDLRPTALDRLGLISALESLAEDITKYSGIRVQVKVNGQVQRLPEDKELVIFRIIQEALRNVWRHSRATEAEVNIVADSREITITVSDNGRGFEVPEDIGNLPAGGQLGMAGMYERAQLIGATLKIDSTVGRGTIVSLRVNAL